MPLKIINAEFVKGAVKAEQFPKLGVPEFAFFGRSNAGKSSLINMLVNRKNLVKTGARPGMTREVNFFLINRPASASAEKTAQKKTAGVFAFTDLPGYGYAKVSGASAQQIDKMLYEYCANRSELKTLFFLMDMRRLPGEMEKNSLVFFQQLNIETVIVGTKADKLGKNDQIKTKKEWSAFFNIAEDLIAVTSSSKKIGKELILSVVDGRCKEK